MSDEVKKRKCDHKLRKQGDIVLYPFITDGRRFSVVWCARCGAIKLTRPECGHEPWTLPGRNLLEGM